MWQQHILSWPVSFTHNTTQSLSLFWNTTLYKYSQECLFNLSCYFEKWIWCFFLQNPTLSFSEHLLLLLLFSFILSRSSTLCVLSLLLLLLNMSRFNANSTVLFLLISTLVSLIGYVLPPFLRLLFTFNFTFFSVNCCSWIEYQQLCVGNKVVIMRKVYFHSTLLLCFYRDTSYQRRVCVWHVSMSVTWWLHLI